MSVPAFMAWLEALAREKRMKAKRERGLWAMREEFVIPLDVARVSPEAAVAVSMFLDDARVVWRTQRTLDGFLSLWRAISRARAGAR